MFDSLDDAMKHDLQSEESTRQRVTRYVVITAVSVVAVGGLFAAVQFVR